MTLKEIKNTLNTQSDMSSVKLVNDFYQITIFYCGNYSYDKSRNKLNNEFIRFSCKCKNTNIMLGSHEKSVFIDMAKSGPLFNIYTHEELNDLIEKLTFAQKTADELQDVMNKYF